MFDILHRSRLDGMEITPRLRLSSAVFAGIAFAVELSAIAATAFLTGIVYHALAYGYPGDLGQFADIGLLAGLIYGFAFLIRDEYSIESFGEGHRTNMRVFLVWNGVFVALAAIGFLTKSTAIFSRGWLLLFYCTGIVVVIAMNAAIQRGLARMIARGLVHRRKLMLVGTEEEIAKLEREISDGAMSVYVAARAVVPADSVNANEAEALLADAAASARTQDIEDVVISSGLSSGEFLDHAISAFSLLPVAIHFGAGGLLSRFKDAEVARFGRATTLSLTRRPLGPFEALSKRAFDIVSSFVALVFLSPLLLAIAALIKLDSNGPVLFRQRRRGYNLVEFGIWKFRTMTTMDDGAVVRQATADDTRTTRIGRWLRKYSLDELPQLVNVLRGDMSLVGPRPHAVAHDELFEKRIPRYPRRLNVKPGITGWAQVNGFRGATETDDKMSMRVEHDLYYIDNWSVAFDVYIVLLTIFSRRASQNAY